MQGFANGYLFGRLLYQLGVQPDVEKFEDKRTPDSMINNYTRLQVSWGAMPLLVHVACVWLFVAWTAMNLAASRCRPHLSGWASRLTPAWQTL